MLTYALARGSLSLVKGAYASRLKHAPQGTLEGVIKMEEALRPCSNADQVFSRAAGVYSVQRGNPSLFSCFQHHTLNIEVRSAAGRLSDEKGGAQFISDDPGVLMMKALGERQSVHVPQIANLDKRGIEQRILDSQGRQAFGDQEVEVELIDDKQKEQAFFPSRHIIGILPMGFAAERGALLITPLGLERSTPIGFGFIYEYSENKAFSAASIQEARTYSALFTKQIVERLMAEITAGKGTSG